MKTTAVTKSSSSISSNGVCGTTAMMMTALVGMMLMNGVSGFSIAGVSGTRSLRRTGTAFHSSTESASRWWPKQNATPEKNTDRSEEEAVDEYLEFLDRRYRRLHDDEKTQEASNKGFSAWKWLKPEQASEDAASQQKQEDALYVLGVAGLASKKLLQKHHLAVAPKHHAIDVPTAPIDSMTPISKAVVLLNETSKVLSTVSYNRKLLIRYQSMKLRSLMLASLRGPVSVARKLWQLGGGKHTVACTVTLALGLAFLLKPVLFVANESINMTGGL